MRRALFAASALFILYATTIPWDFDRPPSLAGFDLRRAWGGAGPRGPSLSDFVQNVALFLPFGFFGVLASAGRRRVPPVLGVVAVIVAAAGWSAFAELLQSMSVERQSNLRDVIASTTGALVGALGAAAYLGGLAAPLERGVRRLIAVNPGAAPAAGLLVVACTSTLQPFFPTLEIGHLRRVLRHLQAAPFEVHRDANLTYEALLMFGVAFLACTGLAAARHRRPAGAAWVMTSIAALGLEITQLTIHHATPGVSDLVINAVAAAAGAFAGRYAEPHEHRPGALTAAMPLSALGFVVLVPAVRALAPFELRSYADGTWGLTDEDFLPFWILLNGLDVRTFANVFGAIAAYSPLGYVLAALRWRPRLVLGAAVGIAGCLEFAQIFIVTRTLDPTECVWAAIGATIGLFAFEHVRATTAAWQTS